MRSWHTITYLIASSSPPGRGSAISSPGQVVLLHEQRRRRKQVISCQYNLYRRVQMVGLQLRNDKAFTLQEHRVFKTKELDIGQLGNN